MSNLVSHLLGVCTSTSLLTVQQSSLLCLFPRQAVEQSAWLLCLESTYCCCPSFPVWC